MANVTPTQALHSILAAICIAAVVGIGWLVITLTGA